MALFVEQYELGKGLFEPKVAGGSGCGAIFSVGFDWRQASLPAFFAPAAAPTLTDVSLLPITATSHQMTLMP